MTTPATYAEGTMTRVARGTVVPASVALKSRGGGGAILRQLQGDQVVNGDDHRAIDPARGSEPRHMEQVHLGRCRRAGHASEIPTEPRETAQRGDQAAGRRQRNQIDAQMAVSKCVDQRFDIGAHSRVWIVQRNDIESNFQRFFHASGLVYRRSCTATPIRTRPFEMLSQSQVGDVRNSNQPCCVGAVSIAAEDTASASRTWLAATRRLQSNGGSVWQKPHRRASILEVTCK